jgi:hypothetical protein
MPRLFPHSLTTSSSTRPASPHQPANMGDVNAEYFTSSITFYEDPNQPQDDEEWNSTLRHRATWANQSNLAHDGLDEHDALLSGSHKDSEHYDSSSWADDSPVIDGIEVDTVELTDKPPFMTRLRSVFISFCVFMAGVCWIGLDWIGLDWIGLDWIGLDWIGLLMKCVGCRLV